MSAADSAALSQELDVTRAKLDAALLVIDEVLGVARALRTELATVNRRLEVEKFLLEECNKRLAAAEADMPRTAVDASTTATTPDGGAL